jgi:hypothetical protein
MTLASRCRGRKTDRKRAGEGLQQIRSVCALGVGEIPDRRRMSYPHEQLRITILEPGSRHRTSLQSPRGHLPLHRALPSAPNERKQASSWISPLPGPLGMLGALPQRSSPLPILVGVSGHFAVTSPPSKPSTCVIVSESDFDGGFPVFGLALLFKFASCFSLK